MVDLLPDPREFSWALQTEFRSENRLMKLAWLDTLGKSEVSVYPNPFDPFVLALPNVA